MTDIKKIIAHCRDRAYMSGAERDKARVRQTGEVFTPTPLVQEMLDELPAELFSDPTKTFLDNSCGDGQFLSEVLIRKVENGTPFVTALSTIYGVDLMPDNVTLCRDRLLCGQEEYRHIVNRNIVCHDGLTYDYSFNGTNLTNQELQEQTLGISPTTKTVKETKKKQKTKTTFGNLFFE